MLQFWKPRGDYLETSGWSERVPEKIKELASRRGLAQWEHFQNWTQARLSTLRDPQKLEGMKSAVDRLTQALKNQECVAIYGDFDLDGTSALALLKTSFFKMGFQNIKIYQPSRLTEGYGLHVHAVESLKNQGVQVIVSVDVGITAVEAAQKCRELGVDLIITDHHLPGPLLPEAFALINPNQVNCNSELGHLSGVGVAFYLAWALRRQLIILGIISESQIDLKELLDCFVIGTLTDMVPIRDENRVLVKHGLIQLTKTKRPGIRFLLEELDLLGRDLSSQDVAIRFAPKLNALSRMEKNIRPLDLFVVECENEARSLLGQVLAQNELRVSLQSESEQLALKMAKEWEDKPFIFIYEESFHKGIIGLVATRLSQVHKKPVFVGSLSPERTIVGSCRAPNDWNGNLVQALEAAGSKLLRFGGHSNAAGFEYHEKDFAEIVELLLGYFSELENVAVERSILYDVNLSLSQVTPDFMAWIDTIGPFGQGFEPPVFKFEAVDIVGTRELRGGHRRLELSHGGVSRDALIFGPTETQIETLSHHRKIDLLAEMQWNYFQNRKKLQLLIKDMAPTIM